MPHGTKNRHRLRSPRFIGSQTKKIRAKKIAVENEVPLLQCIIIPVTHYQQNCSLIWCDETTEAALIDPGGDAERLLAAIAERKLKLTKIFLTHGHLDHVGAANQIAQDFNIPIIGPHEADNFWLDMLDQQAARMGFAASTNFRSTQYLNDGDAVTLGNQTLAVRFCPGHTPGHIIFYSSDVKVAWVGDVLFKGSIGRTDFPRGDYDTLVTSIREKLWPLGDDVTFVPGHGPLSTFGEERQTNPFVADKRFG